MSSYGMNYGYAPTQSYGAVAYSPNYTGGSLYGYSNNPYGLYGQNPSMTLAESPYARLTGQTTQFSSSAIPNLSSYIQPMMVDMNSFLGNTTGIPAYPSFIGSTAMMNSNQPLYNTYQDYRSSQQPSYGYNTGYSNYGSNYGNYNTGYANTGYNTGYSNYGSSYGNYNNGYANSGYNTGYSNYGSSYGYAQQQNPFCGVTCFPSGGTTTVVNNYFC